MPKTKWQYFKDDEVKGLDNELVAKLDQARHIAKMPFVITSGYRTAEHNYVAGGVDDSAHTKGMAVDLLCHDSSHAGHIKRGLYAAGFKRIGNYYKLAADGSPCWSGIHVDCDSTKPQDVEWIKIRK